MIILSKAELYASLKIEFPAFSRGVFIQVPLRLNNDFKFPLCACLAAVDILFWLFYFFVTSLLTTSLSSSQRAF